MRQVVRELNTACGKNGARFRLKTTRLGPARLAESNVILIDGKPLEQLVPGARVKRTDCPSCGEISGKPATCRALALGGRTYESIPADLIRAAVCRAADCCGEGCAGDCGCGAGGKPASKAQCCA